MNDEPQPPASREVPRVIRRQTDAPQTGIIRRAPTGAIPTSVDDSHTRIIRRGPTGQLPRQTAGRPSRRRRTERAAASAATSIATAAVSVVSGWATAVIATELIIGWWHTDRLLCVAVGFLAAVFAVTTVAGLISLLLRRGVGRWLIIAGAAVALLTFAGIFVAGAKVPLVVYAVPALPLASVVLALLGSTRRWCEQR